MSVPRRRATTDSAMSMPAETPDEVMRILSRHLGEVLDLGKLTGSWSLSEPA